MSLRHPEQETLERLQSKTLDAQLRQILVAGLNCSPFEADAVIAAAQEVYFPFFERGGETRALPGRVTLVAVAAEEPAGKPVADCAKRNVSLQLHRGAADDQLLASEGPRGFRRRRIPELCQEALSQGALLTREDLAFRVFFVGLRTVSRDLAWLRQNDSRPLPLRSTMHDIGPVLSHRVEIVRLALEGKTTSEICSMLRHSPEAVANYLGTFTRCAQLAAEGFEAGQIAFVLRRGRGLIGRYLELVEQARGDKLWRYHLEELLAVGRASGEKKLSGSSHGR
jgi:DNA-binding CsgD family transcriptional regulator